MPSLPWQKQSTSAVTAWSAGQNGPGPRPAVPSDEPADLDVDWPKERASTGGRRRVSLAGRPVPDAASRRARSLRTKDGQMVDIATMNLPDSVKNLLVELDLEGTGEVSEKNLEDALMLMKAMKKGLDVDGDGSVGKDELEEGVDLLSKLAHGKAKNSGDLDYQYMPECIQSVFREWDADGSGQVSVSELAAAAQAFKKIQQEGRLMRKIILGLAFVLTLMLAGTFALSFTAVELAKESHVEGGKTVDLSGNVVATRSSDFEVCADGSMAGWGKCGGNSTSGRRLSDTSSDLLKTVPVRQRDVLTSSMPDAFFIALDEVVVFSDKGHTLRLQVAGFARVPVLNSRCGNIVHLYTAWNGRLTLDSTDLSFDAETEAAFANAGFSLIMGGLGGRRLQEDHTVEGFFSAVQGVERQGWTCEDVPLPSLPTTYAQHITVYRPCAVEGVTGSTMDMCDSRYGGVLPGVGKLDRKHQLSTMTKTARIRASLSVDVPIASTLFSKVEIETMKSAGLELQVVKMSNHPGQEKVFLFNRATTEDVHFQVLAGHEADGRFFCNSSGAEEETVQKRELASESAGVDRRMHFEFLDLVEEEGRILRHFRMMPSEAFLEWMSAKAASDRPQDAYYEFWDDADTLTPYRLLNPDGSMVVFNSVRGGTTDEDIAARLAELGAGAWGSTFECSAEEKTVEGAMSQTLGMPVPMMLGPMGDLTFDDVAFYAKYNLDKMIEDEAGNGWETLNRRSEGEGPLADFARYAQRSRSPIAVPDVCADICADELAALAAELKADPELAVCDAPSLVTATRCIIDVAAVRTQACTKNNFVSTINGECVDEAAARRLSAGEAELEEDDSLQGSELYLHRIGRGRASGATKQSTMTTLGDGTKAIDISVLDAAQRQQLAEMLGVKTLSGGRVLFNATDDLPSQQVVAMLQAQEDDSTTHSRKLMMDMACLGFGVGPGCLFKIGYPWNCDPIGGSPRCTFGLAVKVQIGGPANGALTVAGSGCIEEWAFGVPKPFSGSVCIDGGISVSWSPVCGLPFSLAGWVGLTAQVGLDLVLFSFSLASIRIEAGASVESYKYNCDDRRRRRRGWGGRRRGADQTCSTACDIKVYAKATFQVFIGRVWALVQYWVRNKDFDFILGADIYIWAIFTSWWETVAKVQIV